MKRTLLASLAVLLLWVPVTARGQSLRESLLAPAPQGASLTQRQADVPAAEPTPFMKHAAAATILGAIQIVAGAGIILGGLFDPSCRPANGCRNDAAFPMMVAGSVQLVSGAIAASAGIPMWIYGAREQRRALQLSASGLRLTF